MSIMSKFAGMPEDTIIWYLNELLFEKKIVISKVAGFFEKELKLPGWTFELSRIGKLGVMVVISHVDEEDTLCYYYDDIPKLKKGICISPKDVSWEEYDNED